MGRPRPHGEALVVEDGGHARRLVLCLLAHHGQRLATHHARLPVLLVQQICHLRRVLVRIHIGAGLDDESQGNCCSALYLARRRRQPRATAPHRQRVGARLAKVVFKQILQGVALVGGVFTHVAHGQCCRAADLPLGMAQEAGERAPGRAVLLHRLAHQPARLGRGKPDFVVVVADALHDLVTVLLAIVAHEAQGVQGLQPRAGLVNLRGDVLRTTRAGIPQPAQRHTSCTLNLRRLVAEHLRELVCAVLGAEDAHGRAGAAADGLILIVEESLHGRQGAGRRGPHDGEAHARRVLHLRVFVV
mmetsp:Transcript_79629/g.245656  ORF Transcript_79629/g.245656 Transcript_79629/m.245656 type:complete len:303 (+) Transcript_79629:605-1513(+)